MGTRPDRSAPTAAHDHQAADVEERVAELLMSHPAACPLWPEQTEGPYHRESPPERVEITEDRPGVPLEVGLRLVTGEPVGPLEGIFVEVWHADHAGRYSGFPQFTAQPGEVVTSESVPREIVARGETFLRGAQRTDEQGMCAFKTIYPGWYSSRTVHIHMRARFGDRIATTQLYFPDEVTDGVFEASPYRARPSRDTTNDTDSIFIEQGGETAVLNLTGSVTRGYIATICFSVAHSEE